MNIDSIPALISTLGFPIVCAVVLAYIVKYMFDKYTNDIQNLVATNKAESDKFSEALNQNTQVLAKLCDKLDSILDDVKGKD